MELPICFSVQVDVDIKKLAKRFNAQISTDSYADFMAQRDTEQQIDAQELKEIFGLKRKPSKALYKIPEEDKRIYPGYFTHIMTLENDKRILEPMRYRVRPHGSSEEIPTKFNVFNARLDSLEKRKTWSSLFMRKHGIIPFTRFYEWVEHENKKKLITFSPENHEVMWAPCLWDTWVSKDKKFHFKSFAIITSGPPDEIKQMGHDRCPIFLQENHIDSWLSPEKEEVNEVYEMLEQKEQTYYNYKWVD